MKSRYASQTTVSSEQSRSEIERTLQRYGADAFSYAWTPGKAIMAFRADNRMIRFVLPLPERDAPEYTRYQRGNTTYLREPGQAEKLWEQACRQKWRALALVIKAKLEAVESGITEFEDEFLAHIVLPDGRRFGDWAKPQVEQAYLEGVMPPLLLTAGVE